MSKSNKARAVLVSPHCTTLQKRQSCRDKTRPAALGSGPDHKVGGGDFVG